MDKIGLFVCLLDVIPFVILTNRLRMKYRNTKAWLVIQFCWFLSWLIVYFLVLKPHYTTVQNIVVGTFVAGGFVYFVYMFKRIFKS